MTAFTRTFRIGGDYGVQPKWTEHDWVQELFKYWTLPGDDRTDGKALRIGIRNGYLNLYAQGQSVAKFSVPSGKPSVFMSTTYLEGRTKVSGRSPSKSRNATDAERKPENIDSWIETALTFSGDEKRFVDDLVAASPNVIDLEMALSTPDSPQGRKLSRMDVVVVQTNTNAPTIAFWEAKCSNNSELRARKEIEISPTGQRISGAHVAEQISDYEFKLRDDQLRTRIGDQYRETAKILCALCAAFGKGTPPISWTALADWVGPVNVIRRPGLVIGSYKPKGSPSEADISGYGESFERLHRERLEQRAITIKTYADRPTEGKKLAPLPTLVPAI